MSAPFAVAGVLFWASVSPEAAGGRTPQAVDVGAAWAATAPSVTAPLDRFIVEASQRFGVPQAWIRAVIRAESGFDPNAVSSAGAMGLMQLMPDTYDEMRTRHGLGPDPFAPRDNVFAGSAYLRHLYERFGPSGVLAAYNAGPGRYREHLQTGRPLPAETVAYERRVRRTLASSPSGIAPPAVTPMAAWVSTAPADPYASPLFVGRPAYARPGVEPPAVRQVGKALRPTSFPREGQRL